MRKIINLLIIVMIASVAVQADDYPIWYRVTSPANVRLGAGAEFDSFYTLTPREEVPGKEPEGGWVEINCYGFRGFIPSECVSKKESMTYLGYYYITGYDGCKDCSPNGITASQTRPVVGRTVAIAGLPFGTHIYIEGIGYRTVEDRGVGAGVVDVFVGSHSEAYALTSHRKVYIVK